MCFNNTSPRVLETALLSNATDYERLVYLFAVQLYVVLSKKSVNNLLIKGVGDKYIGLPVTASQ